MDPPEKKGDTRPPAVKQVAECRSKRLLQDTGALRMAVVLSLFFPSSEFNRRLLSPLGWLTFGCKRFALSRTILSS